MKRLGVLFAAALACCGLFLAQGCASTERTSTVTTSTRVSGGGASSQTVPGDSTADTSPASTTTTTTTQSDEPDSVLGATLHLVGTIILLPFRIVGDVLGALV